MFWLNPPKTLYFDAFCHCPPRFRFFPCDGVPASGQAFCLWVYVPTPLFFLIPCFFCCFLERSVHLEITSPFLAIPFFFILHLSRAPLPTSYLLFSHQDSLKECLIHPPPPPPTSFLTSIGHCISPPPIVLGSFQVWPTIRDFSSPSKLWVPPLFSTSSFLPPLPNDASRPRSIFSFFFFLFSLCVSLVARPRFWKEFLQVLSAMPWFAPFGAY